MDDDEFDKLIEQVVSEHRPCCFAAAESPSRLFTHLRRDHGWSRAKAARVSGVPTDWSFEFKAEP